MPTLQTLLLFLAADIALKLTPGPDMALTLTRGMTQGFRTAWFSVLGTWSAGFVQIPLVVLGLAALFQHSPLLFSAVKILGALYLVYLARAPAALRPASGGAGRGHAGKVGARCVLAGAVHQPAQSQGVSLPGGVFAAIRRPGPRPGLAADAAAGLMSKMLGLGTGACFAYGASRIRGWLMRNPWFLRLQEGLLGAAMLGIAGWLLLNRDPLPGR